MLKPGLLCYGLLCQKPRVRVTFNVKRVTWFRRCDVKRYTFHFHERMVFDRARCPVEPLRRCMVSRTYVAPDYAPEMIMTNARSVIIAQ